MTAETDPDGLSVENLLDRFAEAWASGDADRVAALFAPHGVYHASVGPEPGERARGREAIRGLVGRMLALDSATATQITSRTVMPGGAVWTWSYETDDDTTVLGCDIVRVENGLLVLKDAYRKVAR